MVSWRDSIVWTNAMSKMVGLQPVYTYQDSVIRDSTNATACDNAVQEDTKGFRLPTSNEWELAARYIDGTSWTPGNYASGATGPAWNGHWRTGSAVDMEATREVAWYGVWDGSGNTEKKQDVGLLRANWMGLYDMSGNVWEWFYYWHLSYSGSARVDRGGSWDYDANGLRVGSVSGYLGFRPVRTQF